jgi:hypothetical protein
LGWGMGKPGGEGLSSMMRVEDIPEYLRPHLQDWIAATQVQPALK